MKKGITIQIQLTNKWLYFLAGVLIVSVFSMGVWAYNANGIGGNASIMGHSADEIAGLPNLTGMDYVVTTWRSSDNTSWYRKYNSGWIEQGGISFANDYTAINLPTSFTNNKYTLILTYFGGSSTSEEKWTTAEYNAGMYVYGRTTSSFKKETSWTLTGGGNANRPVIFYASGF